MQSNNFPIHVWERLVRLFANQTCQSMTTENVYPDSKLSHFPNSWLALIAFGCLITRRVTWHNLLYNNHLWTQENIKQKIAITEPFLKMTELIITT